MEMEQVNENNIEYTFIFMNGGWWLKISTIKELTDYLIATDSRWEQALNNLLNSKEFTKHGMEHAGAIATAIGFYGTNRNLNGVDATLLLREQLVDDQLNEIRNGNTVVINRNGGYFILRDKDLSGDTKKYSQWCKKKELIFPDFKKNELKIERFPMGTHWYAYLGDMQIRDNDRLKWDSYEEAYEYAQQFIKDNK